MPPPRRSVEYDKQSEGVKCQLEKSRPRASQPCAPNAVHDLFNSSDLNRDGFLGRAEAEAVRESVRKVLLQHRCVVASGRACYGKHADVDGLVSESEHARSFVPCLLSGLSAACRALVC